MPPPASSHDPGIDGVKARDDGRHVGQEPCIVEAGVQARKGQALRDARVGGEEVVERASLVCGAERAALNDRIRLLPRHPAVLDERDEDARGRVEAQSPLDVLAHPLGPDDQALDEAGHLRQHVVEEDRGVREEHPLGAAVADVALVPERLVLQRRARVAAQEPGQPGDPLAQDRVALVGHRGAALLTGPEGLHQLPISVCWRLRTSVAKRSREPPVIAIAATTAACRSRWTIWVLTGSASSPRSARTSASRSGARRLYVPTGPEILPVAMSSKARARRARSRASSNAQPASLSPSVVGSAWTEWVRPIITVSASDRARATSATRSASASPRRRSPAARSWSASPVSTTSLLVRPRWRKRPSGPTDSATWLTNAITSWSVVFSISAIRSTSTRARLAIAA